MNIDDLSFLDASSHIRHFANVQSCVLNEFLINYFHGGPTLLLLCPSDQFPMLNKNYIQASSPTPSNVKTTEQILISLVCFWYIYFV